MLHFFRIKVSKERYSIMCWH